jgi:hypothetical protein
MLRDEFTQLTSHSITVTGFRYPRACRIRKNLMIWFFLIFFKKIIDHFIFRALVTLQQSANWYWGWNHDLLTLFYNCIICQKCFIRKFKKGALRKKKLYMIWSWSKIIFLKKGDLDLIFYQVLGDDLDLIFYHFLNDLSNVWFSVLFFRPLA